MLIFLQYSGKLQDLQNLLPMNNLINIVKSPTRISSHTKSLIDIIIVSNTNIDRRRHSSIIDVRSFRGADCDTNHYQVVAKVRERLAVVRKQAAQKSDGEDLI